MIFNRKISFAVVQQKIHDTNLRHFIGKKLLHFQDLVFSFLRLVHKLILLHQLGSEICTNQRQQR